MTMGEEFAEPLINAELGPPPISSSMLVHADNYGAVNRPLSDGHGSNPMGHEPERGPSRWLRSEIQEQCWLSLPIMAMYGLQFVMLMSGMTFVGHLGAFSLSAVSLGNSFAGITGLAVLVRQFCNPSQSLQLLLAAFYSTRFPIWNVGMHLLVLLLVAILGLHSRACVCWQPSTSSVTILFPGSWWEGGYGCNCQSSLLQLFWL